MGPPDESTSPRLMEDAELVPRSSYRRHFSPFLRWIWHFQDFYLHEVQLSRGTFALQGLFSPRFTPILRLTHMKRRQPARLGLPTSVRLANHAALIASGLLLRKDRKDSDVIAEYFDIRCARPILYGPDDSVPIRIELHSLTESMGSFVYHATFALGATSEHTGRLVHHYTKPKRTSGDTSSLS